jgi:phosphoglycolate phosphatase
MLSKIGPTADIPPLVCGKMTICNGILPPESLPFPTMPLPALIFDLDGTLVDTAPDLLNALNAVLVEEGRRPADIGDLRHLVGHGARLMLGEAFARTGTRPTPERVEALIDRFIVHYRDRLVDESRPYPGVEDTLAALKRDGARMAVLTNKPEEMAVPLLRALDLTQYFEAIHGAGRYSYMKPDPRVLHHVLDELGGDRGHAVMIGDSPTDVATARAGGIPVIVLSYGYSPTPPHELGADALIDGFSQIPTTVARLNIDAS